MRARLAGVALASLAGCQLLLNEAELTPLVGGSDGGDGGCLSCEPTPVIASVQPNPFPADQFVTVTVLGSGFDCNGNITLKANGTIRGVGQPTCVHSGQGDSLTVVSLGQFSAGTTVDFVVFNNGTVASKAFPVPVVGDGGTLPADGGSDGGDAGGSADAGELDAGGSDGGSCSGPAPNLVLSPSTVPTHIPFTLTASDLDSGFQQCSTLTWADGGALPYPVQYGSPASMSVWFPQGLSGGTYSFQASTGTSRSNPGTVTAGCDAGAPPARIPGSLQLVSLVTTPPTTFTRASQSLLAAVTPTGLTVFGLDGALSNTFNSLQIVDAGTFVWPKVVPLGPATFAVAAADRTGAPFVQFVSISGGSTTTTGTWNPQPSSGVSSVAVATDQAGLVLAWIDPNGQAYAAWNMVGTSNTSQTLSILSSSPLEIALAPPSGSSFRYGLASRDSTGHVHQLELSAGISGVTVVTDSILGTGSGVRIAPDGDGGFTTAWTDTSGFLLVDHALSGGMQYGQGTVEALTALPLPTVSPPFPYALGYADPSGRLFLQRLDADAGLLVPAIPVGYLGSSFPSASVSWLGDAYGVAFDADGGGVRVGAVCN